MSLVYFLMHNTQITNDNIYLVFDESKEESIKTVGKSANHIRKAVCDITNIKLDVIDSKCRKREIVEARQLCHYFAWYFNLGSLSEIGFEFGNKDHATVLHSKRTVLNLYETNSEYAKKFDEIKQLIEKY